jgi:Putative transposase of IS4/5 family (DUF4096)
MAPVPADQRRRARGVQHVAPEMPGYDLFGIFPQERSPPSVPSWRRFLNVAFESNCEERRPLCYVRLAADSGGAEALDGVGDDVIPARKPEPRIMPYELTDREWSVIKPMLPNKPRGVPRVDDRRVPNGIFWMLRSGAPRRDLPESYGPRTTCYNLLQSVRSLAAGSRLGPAHECPDRHS